MTELSQTDRDALTRALETARAESESERKRFDREETEQGWQWAAETAAYHCQDRALKLRPWQPPPCWIWNVEADLTAGDDGIGGRYAAALLTRRLLQASLSRYEPDPLGALERAEANRVATASNA